MKNTHNSTNKKVAVLIVLDYNTKLCNNDASIVNI